MVASSSGTSDIGEPTIALETDTAAGSSMHSTEATAVKRR
jgi:hypothetical protein